MGWPGPMTHRQFLLWQTWASQENNRPSRTDYYMMQLACELAKTPLRVWGKEPKDIKIGDFKLKFERMEKTTGGGGKKGSRDQKPYDPQDPNTWVYTKKNIAKVKTSVARFQRGLLTPESKPNPKPKPKPKRNG